MYLMEKVSNDISQKISAILECDKEQTEIIAYGALVLIQTSIAFILILIVGILLNVLYETVVISITAASLRKYSGGAHSASPNRCAVMGAIIFNTIALATNSFFSSANAITIVPFSAICFAFVYCILYRYCPVDSPNKPINNVEFKKRLRKKSFYVTSIFLIISILLMIFYYINYNHVLLYTIICISLGLVWQALTLFYPGKFITYLLDSLLIKILCLRRWQ